jgi:hypothetical protein
MDNKDKICSNFSCATTVLEIPMLIAFCDDLMTKFLTEQSAMQINSVDGIFDKSICSLIFVSPFPLLIHLYVLSMIKLNFAHVKLIDRTFTMDACLLLLKECYENDELPIKKFLYEQTGDIYKRYAEQRQMKEGGNWNPYPDDSSTDTEEESNKNE